MATSGSVSTSKYDGRYYTVSWTATQSATDNTSTVKWTLKAVGGNSGWYAERTLKVVLGGATVYSKTTRVQRYAGTIASGSKVINHDTNGDASFSISIQAAVYVSTVNCTGSKSFTLTNIPRASVLSVGAGFLGTKQTVTITRYSSSFRHNLVASCGGNVVSILDDRGATSGTTSKTWTPPLSWAAANTTGTVVTVTFSLLTYNSSGTKIGASYKTVTYGIPASVKPSCSLSVTDATGNLDKYGGYIKGYSKFAVTVTPKLAYNSAIASYSAKANGATYTKASFTTGVLTSTGTVTISATVKDKRGRSSDTTSKSVTVLAYSAPKVSKLTVGRCDKDGTTNEKGSYVKVTFSGTVTSLNSKNSATYTLKYKKSTATSYTTVAMTDYKNKYSVSNASYIFAADTGSSYDVQLVITDDFKTTTRTTSASTAFTLMHFSKGGTGLGIGKVAEEENLLDIGIPVKFAEGIVSNLLWSGVLYMTSGHTAELSQPVSKQANGIVLVFSAYADGKAENYHFETKFIPKYMVSKHSGFGCDLIFATSQFGVIGAKYLYISDSQIGGHDDNNKTGTASGVTYNNAHWVLRYVIGV